MCTVTSKDIIEIFKRQNHAIITKSKPLGKRIPEVPCPNS